VNTIAGHEAMHMIRKGQVRWLAKGNTLGQRAFVHELFGIAARRLIDSSPTRTAHRGCLRQNPENR